MIDRDVILDLLPLYRAGLGSPATRALVEDWLAAHPDLADARAVPAEPRLREAFERARRRARVRRWLFGAALALTAVSLAIRLEFAGGRLVSAHLLALDAPALFAPMALTAVAAWLGYWRVTRGA